MEQVVMEADAPPAGEHSDIFTKSTGSGFVTLCYDPPYANDLDDQMARHLVAYLVPAASLDYRARVWAAHSMCRFDFLIDLGTRRVAIDYRDTPVNLETALVEDNDALALGTGIVDTILRVRRQDLNDYLYDCLHVIAKWEPNLFTPYGQRMFASRAGAEARSTFPAPESELVTIRYRSEQMDEPTLVVRDASSNDEVEWPDGERDERDVAIRRMSRDAPDAWKHHYDRAALVYGRHPIRRNRRSA